MTVRLPDAVAASRQGRTVLHIGTMKSGTSYLQDVLDRNREGLDEAGQIVCGTVLAAALAVGADEVGVAELADRRCAIALASGPEVATGKAAKHRRPSGARALAL